MNDRQDIDGSEAAHEEALVWFTRLQDEAAGADDWAKFEAWLSVSGNAEAYERLEHLWVDVEAPEVAAALAPAPVVALAPRRTTTRRNWLVAGAGLAATVAVGAITAQALRPTPGEPYATRPGETRLIVLADGTHMRLNAATRVVVRVDRQARRVELAEGEATFDVTHDPARPFRIDVGDRDIRVVGTEFNLRRRGGRVALNVRRGLVEVRPDGQGAPVRVAAGQQFVHREGQEGGVLRTAAPDAAFAWTGGQFVYRDAPMGEVAADLSRSLGVPIRVGNAATGRLRFTGVLTLEDPAIVMRRLQAFAPVRVERDGDALVLRKTSAH